MTFQQRKLIINPFAISHFSYCSIVLIFHSRQLNNGINNIHERALQIIYQDYTSFTRLLAKDNSSTIHYRNLQKLVIVMFRVKTGKISELLKSQIFGKKQQYQICKLWYSCGIFLWSKNLECNTRSVSKYKFNFSFQRKYKEVDS